MLKTATGGVANLLNEDTPTYRLPPEILARVLYLAVDHGSEKHAGQIIPLTHVCRYWRSILLANPRMWSTLSMKPGNPDVISEWLARSQNVPLTIIAEFVDEYNHPPCRYQDSETATLADTPELGVCPRHKAVLSLDQLLPHRSRIHDFSILVHSSDPNWDDGLHRGEPVLLSHHFFCKPLLNLQHLDLRATHVEGTRHAIPTPEFLFAGHLPSLKALKYLGVTGGLTRTARDLVSCEFGYWSGSAGTAIIAAEVLQRLFNNNTTLQSLTITQGGFFANSRSRVPTPAPMMDLKYLEIQCPINDVLEKIVDGIHAPQFRSLDTVQLSLPLPTISVVATDGSGHTFKFSQSIENDTNFFSLQHLGAVVTTLRLDQGQTLGTLRLDQGSALYDFFQTLDTVQVLELSGEIDSVKTVLSDVVSIAGVFPGLRTIGIALSRDDYGEALQLLATASRLRMEEGNPLTTIEPLLTGCENGLGQELRVEWEKHYEAAGIQNFLSK